MKYIFSTQGELRAACSELLRLQPADTTPESLLERIVEQVGGPIVAIMHCTRTKQQCWYLEAHMAKRRAKEPAGAHH
jgi:hypothetical protein